MIWMLVFGFWFLGALMAWAFIYGAVLRGKEYDEDMEKEIVKQQADNRKGGFTNGLLTEVEAIERDEPLSCKEGWHDLDSGLARCSTSICGEQPDRHKGCEDASGTTRCSVTSIKGRRK